MSGRIDDAIRPHYDSIIESPQFGNEDNSFEAQLRENIGFISERLKVYEIEHRNSFNLRHIRDSETKDFKFIAESKARRLSELTHNQAYIEFVGALFKGGLSIIGVTQAEHIQKLFTGVGEAVGLLSYVGKTYYDSKKIPLQTELELIKGSKIPELERYARDYLETLRDLRNALDAMTKSENDTVHNIHRN
ncbi:MAG TPA: hypothetical protein VLF61_03405 [Rhabdochlamydiaceae bacterium]|nr:hypothetical protein [Rhabdochlamydiaceae bacterium]